MLLKILKKDLTRRKGVNAILLIFITIATIFLASSVNNIMVVSSAINYYFDYANLPDFNFFTVGMDEDEAMQKFLKEDSQYVDYYDSNTLLNVTKNNIFQYNTGKKKEMKYEMTSVFAGTMDADYNKVYDMEGKPFILKDGEIAMLQVLMDKYDLVLGDKLCIVFGSTEKQLVLKYMMKDAAYGNEMVGIHRIMLSAEDFNLFEKVESAGKIGVYYVVSKDLKSFSKEFSRQGYRSIIFEADRSTYELAYSFDMIVAALLIMIGICLILIALLVLRFTLVFTMEEDYREIGIMKAVGFRNFSIEKIYLIKYLVIVCVGALIGLVISFPISEFMIAGVSANMVMEDSGKNMWANIICSVFVILLVMLFCYSCTRKLNKISAIVAIRNGQSGERYKKRAGLCLYQKKKLRVTVFLGINDILSHTKRYMVLIITFCISFILITIPLNTLNTMRSREMVEKFSVNPDSAVYLKNVDGAEGMADGGSESLETNINKLEKELKKKGYDAELSAVVLFNFRYFDDEQEEKHILTTLKKLGSQEEYWNYSKGEAPMLINEIAFSEKVMKEYDWKIGDVVKTVVGNEEKSFIITGSYSDYMNLGRSARFNPKIDCSTDVMTSCWVIMMDMETDKTQAELAEELKTVFPDYEWFTAQDFVDKNVGSIQATLDKLLIPMTALLCLIIMLITLLMEKLFIVREKGEIAMLKSIGFRNKHVRNWQIIRMVSVVLVSMVAAIPLSLLSNAFVLKPIFSIMGAQVQIQVVVWQVYVVYPGALLIGIIASTVFATRSVRNINIRELNNLE